jgi:hypothetical protein
MGLEKMHQTLVEENNLQPVSLHYLLAGGIGGYLCFGTNDPINMQVRDSSNSDKTVWYCLFHRLLYIFFHGFYMDSIEES